MDKEPITLNGLTKLKKELIFLKEKKRPGISKQDQKGNDFITIRLYKGETKMTNMIERGPALEKIIKVKEG